MPSGMLLMQDSKSEFSLAQEDGSGRVPLFKDKDYEGSLSVCGGGHFIVFGSRGVGGSGSNVWRADARGRNLKRLTEGGQDMFPHCSPDGAWVIYNSFSASESRIMRTSIQGGAPSVVAQGHFIGARYSPDGKRIAAFIDVGETEKIAIISSDGGALLRTFDLAPRGTLAWISFWDYSMLHWTPDGRALTYPLLQGTAMNLWEQPVAGGPPQQLTHFNDGIIAYDWSPDGKRLAITRARASSDVVLISNFR
jgi:Tol biopolymer transport system component